MPQPIKNIVKKTLPNKGRCRKKKLETTHAAKVRAIRKKMKGSQEYGTSKLEERFARDFLDRLGIDYEYQYKAESIGRYFDFRLFPNVGGTKVLLEIQGSYWHADPRLYEEKDLNKTQKYDIKVDEIKRKYCERNGIKLLYIWEKDINEHSEKVKSYLKEVLKPYLDGTIENKDKRLRK